MGYVSQICPCYHTGHSVTGCGHGGMAGHGGMTPAMVTHLGVAAHFTKIILKFVITKSGPKSHEICHAIEPFVETPNFTKICHVRRRHKILLRFAHSRCTPL